MKWMDIRTRMVTWPLRGFTCSSGLWNKLSGSLRKPSCQKQSPSGRLQKRQAACKSHHGGCLPLQDAAKIQKGLYEREKGENFELRGGYKGVRPGTRVSGRLHAPPARCMQEGQTFKAQWKRLDVWLRQFLSRFFWFLQGSRLYHYPGQLTGARFCHRPAVLVSRAED